MLEEQLWCFLNSNFFQTAITFLAVVMAYFIGDKQNQINSELKSIQDLVELFACPGVSERKKENELTRELEVVARIHVILLQNVGTRLIYLNRYVFNGIEYILESQVLASSYAQAESKFYIELPSNGVESVSLDVYFTDVSDRKWKSRVAATLQNGTWKVQNWKSILDIGS